MCTRCMFFERINTSALVYIWNLFQEFQCRESETRSSGLFFISKRNYPTRAVLVYIGRFFRLPSSETWLLTCSWMWIAGRSRVGIIAFLTLCPSRVKCKKHWHPASTINYMYIVWERRGLKKKNMLSILYMSRVEGISRHFECYGQLWQQQ